MRAPRHARGAAAGRRRGAAAGRRGRSPSQDGRRRAGRARGAANDGGGRRGGRGPGRRGGRVRRALPRARLLPGARGAPRPPGARCSRVADSAGACTAGFQGAARGAAAARPRVAWREGGVRRGAQVPREVLLLAIRAFGGVAGWAGEGSPLAEGDEAITHQVVDRPAQGHRFLGREYVQPQWVFDSANWRVLADARLYAPGAPPPPHLSPFAGAGEEGEDGYVPEYAKALRKLQARAIDLRSSYAGFELG